MGRGRGNGEIVAVWILLALVAAEIFATYTRLPARDLYHVSGTGLEAGASRVLVFLNYPAALVAIPVLLLLADRRGRAGAALAGIGIALSAAVFWPGMVDQADLDAKPANVIAALGVAIAVAMTIAAGRGQSGLDGRGRRRGDRLRIAIAVVGVVVALPWMAADLGFSFNGLPVLGTLYQTGELRAQPNVPGLHHAVHHGHHHGMDGLLLLLTALLLSRALQNVRRPAVRRWTAAFLALMLVYGSGEILNDFWTEQVLKRGWTTWAVPDVTRPTVSIGWGVIVLVSALVYVLWFGRSGPGIAAASKVRRNALGLP